MSWLLKAGIVLSSAQVVAPGNHDIPRVRRSYLDQNQSVILTDRHFVTTLTLHDDIVLVKCAPDLVVGSLAWLKPNRIGGLSIKPVTFVLIPRRLIAHIEIGVGDQLEIRT